MRINFYCYFSDTLFDDLALKGLGVDVEGKIWYPTAVSRLSFLNQMTTTHIRLASNIDVSLQSDAFRIRLDLRDFTKILTWSV